MHDSQALLQASAGAVSDKTQDLRERLGRTIESAKATCRRLEDKALEGAKAMLVSLFLSLNEAHGVTDQFGTCFQIELALDVRAVGFHCLVAEMHLVGDLTRAFAFS